MLRGERCEGKLASLRKQATEKEDVLFERILQLPLNALVFMDDNAFPSEHCVASEQIEWRSRYSSIFEYGRPLGPPTRNADSTTRSLILSSSSRHEEEEEKEVGLVQIEGAKSSNRMTQGGVSQFINVSSFCLCTLKDTAGACCSQKETRLFDTLHHLKVQTSMYNHSHSDFKSSMQRPRQFRVCNEEDGRALHVKCAAPGQVLHAPRADFLPHFVFMLQTVLAAALA